MVWFLYVVLGILLFGLVTYGVEKYNFTKSQNIILSMIYLLIIAGIFSRIGIADFNENIFMIIVFELFCQLIYISYFLEKDFFNKEERYLTFYIFKIILAFIINQELINKVNDVFLSGEDLKIIVWLLIIVYLYQLFKDKETNNSIVKKDTVISRENIVVSFAKLKLIYDDDIAIEKESKKLVLYAIMIFNNYKRPKLFRKFDDILFRFNNKPRKLGIMQVISKKYINDYESIDIVSKKIEKLYEKKNKDIDVINSYDKDNCKEICNIYEELKKFCKF